MPPRGPDPACLYCHGTGRGGHCVCLLGRAEDTHAITVHLRSMKEPREPWPSDVVRPKTRGDCVGGIRPCPFVGCQWHLYFDQGGHPHALKANFPHLEVWQMKESCALDVADRGGMTLEEVSAALNITRERVRQIETKGLLLLRKKVSRD